MWALLFLAASAAAQPKVDCNNAFTTADMLYCADRDYRVALAEMTKAYQAANALFVSLDMDQEKTRYLQAFVASQSAWLKFREYQCLAEGYSAAGGSMQSLLVSACMGELTKARAKQLQDLIKLYNE